MAPSKVRDSLNTQSFNKYLWNTHYIPGTVPGIANVARKKASVVLVCCSSPIEAARKCEKKVRVVRIKMESFVSTLHKKVNKARRL
jgi:hypothetical protein